MSAEPMKLAFTGAQPAPAGMIPSAPLQGPLTYSPRQKPGGDGEALVRQYLPLVRRIAWHVHGSMSTIVDVEDLVQIGLVALVEAVGHAAEQGAQFRAYLTTRLRGAMIDELRRQATSTRGAMRRRRQYQAAIAAVTARTGRAPDEAAIAAELGGLLAALVAKDDWLAAEFSAADPTRYRQYLLHLDPAARFCVVSFVWGPGQKTPVHDHTVWGLVGVMHGAERCDEYALDNGHPVSTGKSHVMKPGDIEAVSPTVGDWHRVSSASDGTSVSIHVYGANIGAVHRHVFDAATGAPKPFISGYTGDIVPNWWDRSRSAA